MPWLSTIPWLGKTLFGTNLGTQQKTEIILLLTPRIERNLDLPIAQVSTFHSGTEARSSTEGMILRDTSSSLTLKSSGDSSTLSAPLPPPMQQPDATWQPLPPPVEQQAAPPTVPPPVQVAPTPAASVPQTP